MAEPTGPETAGPPAGTGSNAPRDASNWAAKVDRLRVEARAGMRGTNVAGKRLTGPVQGFGKLWQKTYSVDVGTGISPEDAIAVWKAHFPEFWPEGSRFAGALTGISPGDVALLDIAVGGGVKMSTGVFVLYADAESFTFATPQGHQFAGWITFSAERSGEATVVQTQVLLRAGDPLYELGMPVMHRMEDRFWAQTMIALGKRLGVADPAVQTRSVCLDPQRQWRRAGNVWQNSMARSVLQTVVPPLAAPRRRRRRSHGQPAAS
jgi:hypothetical protein